MRKALDPLLHNELRLAIMSNLIANKTTSFTELKAATGASSGNLSVQLKKLQEKDYLEIVKGFKNNYQHTSVSITPSGIDAFEAYVEALKKYLNL